MCTSLMRESVSNTAAIVSFFSIIIQLNDKLVGTFLLDHYIPVATVVLPIFNRCCSTIQRYRHSRPSLGFRGKNKEAGLPQLHTSLNFHSVVVAPFALRSFVVAGKRETVHRT